MQASACWCHIGSNEVTYHNGNGDKIKRLFLTQCLAKFYFLEKIISTSNEPSAHRKTITKYFHSENEGKYCTGI